MAPFASYTIGRGCASGHAVAVIGAAAAGSSLPDGNEQLVTDLGGDAAVIGFWDARNGITLDTGVSQWDDTRGASGYGPSLVQATTSSQPGYDAGAETLTFTGGGIGFIDTLTAPASATFDLSGVARAVVFIGAISNAVASNLYAGGVQDGAFARFLLIRAEASNADIRGITTAGNRAPSVAGHATTRRLVIVAKNATTGSSVEIPNDTKVSGTGSSTASGNNFFCVGAQSDAGNGCTMVLRAVLYLGFEPSAGQVTTLKTYATTYHGVTLV